jgi:transcriptional antiterminator RfaH
MEHWYVVQSQPRAEARAVHHLIRQGYDAYLPRYLKRRRHARKIDVVATPLFPRYLFVRFDVNAVRWRAIRSTMGVTHLVCQGDLPTPAPDGIVEGIRAREDELGFVSMAPDVPFRKGEMVRICDGALAEQLGLFEGVTDEQRVILLLDVLGRRIRVKLPLDSIAACA